MAIYPGNDVEAFKRYLEELEMLLQEEEDSAVRERLATSGALCYAVKVQSYPMMDILIQKGVGKILSYSEQH